MITSNPTAARHRHFIAAAPRIARAFHANRDYAHAGAEPGPSFWALSGACNAVADAIIATRPEEVTLWGAIGIAQDAIAGHFEVTR